MNTVITQHNGYLSPPNSNSSASPYHGEKDGTENLWQHQSSNIIDLLRTAPSRVSFSERVQTLKLSHGLTDKVLGEKTTLDSSALVTPHCLSEENEKELATEVLLYRHKFTILVFENRIFRQAALTIIQNIYLFKQRKIFFGTTNFQAEKERQEALLLFSGSPENSSIPLAKTFQHLILARVWDRIVSRADHSLLSSQSFIELHEVVEKLNTLRNIYMLLTTGLVRKLTMKISDIYRQSVTMEDAHQIGSFGIARAAYRYHPSNGLRFSTYAANWILKEIQRQALQGRLIRISSNVVEQISRAIRSQNKKEERTACQQLARATAQLAFQQEKSQLAEKSSPLTGPAELHEEKELHSLLLQAIDTALTEKSGDVIKRRFGLEPYHGKEQSVIEIAKTYGVTRGSIYQCEQAAMKKLRDKLLPIL